MSEITNNFNQQARETEKAVLGGLMLETERFDSVILKISDKGSAIIEVNNKEKTFSSGIVEINNSI